VWAHQDGIKSSILNADGTVNHAKMVLAINMFTMSVGFKESFENSDAGQNSALSGVSASLKHYCCSILPLIGQHYVPVVISHGHWVNDLRIADYIAFHAYDAPDQVLNAGPLKNTYYKPINGQYIAFLGRQLYRDQGLEDYSWFVSEGGTYRGAPRDYVPKTL
jgi:hypothetical protein